MRVDWRGNGRDAGVLSSGRIRFGRIYCGRGGAEENSDREECETGRYAAGFAVCGIAHQRVLAGAQIDFRNCEVEAGHVCGGSWKQDWRGIAEAACVLCAGVEKYVGEWMGVRAGPHYGRGNSWEFAASFA